MLPNLSALDLRAHSAEPTAAAGQDGPVEVWGRFWLKGHVTEQEKQSMETYYFKEHCREYIQNRGSHGITVDDISGYNFIVRTNLYATPDSAGPPMPVTCVDFQLLFNRTSKAQVFVDWSNDANINFYWHTLAQKMFGIPTLFVDLPSAVFPELKTVGGAANYRYFGSMPSIPFIGRSRYNDAEHWQVLNADDVPSDRRGQGYVDEDEGEGEMEEEDWEALRDE